MLDSAYDPQILSSNSRLSSANEVERAQAGDEDAFTALYQTYQARIYAYVAHMVGSDEEGRDLVQETFIKAWRSLPETNKELRFEAWLYRIATNTALDHLRSQKPLRLFMGLLRKDQYVEQPRIEGPERQVVERDHINCALVQVTPRYRACLLLQNVAGFKQREIADLLHMKEKNVSVYVRDLLI